MKDMEDKTFATVAPPPPSEVRIRTMRSDIASMMQSGGGAPAFESISVPGLSAEKSFKAPAFFATPMPAGGAIQTPTADDAPLPVGGIRNPERPVVGQEVSDAGPGSDFLPKLIVGAVALAALGVVVYFVYVLFLK